MFKNAENPAFSTLYSLLCRAYGENFTLFPRTKRQLLVLSTILLFHLVAIEFSQGLDRLRNSTKRRSLPRKKMLRHFVAFVF